MKYRGTVVKIDESQLSIAVEVDGKACSACHVKSACEVGRKEEKILVIDSAQSSHYQLGDVIWVKGGSKSELKAIILAYVVPFFVMFTALMCSKLLNQTDGISGLIALSVLAFYYLILYFLRDKMKGVFAFSIIN